MSCCAGPSRQKKKKEQIDKPANVPKVQSPGLLTEAGGLPDQAAVDDVREADERAYNFELVDVGMKLARLWGTFDGMAAELDELQRDLLASGQQSEQRAEDKRRAASAFELSSVPKSPRRPQAAAVAAASGRTLTAGAGVLPEGLEWLEVAHMQLQAETAAAACRAQSQPAPDSRSAAGTPPMAPLAATATAVAAAAVHTMVGTPAEERQGSTAPERLRPVAELQRSRPRHVARAGHARSAAFLSHSCGHVSLNQCACSSVETMTVLSPHRPAAATPGWKLTPIPVRLDDNQTSAVELMSASNPAVSSVQSTHRGGPAGELDQDAEAVEPEPVLESALEHEPKLGQNLHADDGPDVLDEELDEEHDEKLKLDEELTEELGEEMERMDEFMDDELDQMSRMCVGTLRSYPRLRSL